MITLNIILGLSTVFAMMVFGFGMGLLIGNPKHSNMLASMWVIFILVLITTLVLYILEVVHEVFFPQLWLGFLILSIVWIGFASFGRFITKEKYNAKTQQRIDTLSKKQNHKEEKE